MSVDVSSLDADALETAARTETDLDDFGDGSHREGLERFTAALREEADLSDTGVAILSGRLTALLVARLQVEQTYRDHPEIADEAAEVLAWRREELTAAKGELEEVRRTRLATEKEDLLSRIRGFFGLFE